MNNFQNLDPETLAAQRAARKAVQKETRILLPVMFVAMLALFYAAINLTHIIPFYVSFALYLGLYILFRVYLNGRQWKVLLDYQLTCPHCGKRLAEKVQYFKSPSSKCPNCRKVALIPVQMLKE